MPMQPLVQDLAVSAATTVAGHLGLRIPLKTGIQLAQRFVSHPDRRAFLKYHAGMNVRNRFIPVDTTAIATPIDTDGQISHRNAWHVFQSIGNHPHSGNRNNARSCYPIIAECLRFIKNDIVKYSNGGLIDRDPVRLVEIGTSCASILRFFQFNHDEIFERELEASLIFLLNDIETLANDIQYYDRTKSFYEQYGSKYSPDMPQIVANKSSFRLAKASAFIRLDAHYRIDYSIVDEALSCEALNTAHHTLSTALKQLASIGEYDEAISLAKSNTNNFHEHVWFDSRKIANLHNEKVVSADHSPRTSLGALYVSYACVVLSRAVDLSRLERRKDIREARRLLIKSDAHFYSVLPPWKHGLAGLYSTAAIASFMTGNLEFSRIYSGYASRYYAMTKDIYRKSIVDNFRQFLYHGANFDDMADIRLKASIQNVLLKD